VESPAQFVEGGGDDLHAADGLARGAAGLHLEADGPAAAVIDVAMVDFGEVVILGGQPEDRHGADAVVAQLAGESGGGQGLVDRVDGSAEQADLLAGDDGDGVGQLELIEGSAFAVDLAQGGDEGFAPFVGEVNLGRGVLERGGVVGIMPVEPRSPRVVIEVVGKERTRAG
jgi:hypothetical protein